ncbi:hypothetical protein PPL_02274 [Heterostelium album PN500]|uniref:Uncharacterized protein n=1 Tax=Heterostelium pallidum (strain ATCC 26659 / Pp 5 / PN500) TaxID=670386 RepID=D3B1V0_HETP5|nr:hypothetical protein PPL_02274 [Heterostelium album PN500]EFA85274.1 hypothetical protein PPL_02274 [Heterostelium album PN500]|eukprot:XP_020437383.1 hypothetical protein PPL_02274 [Heterostelium album PN500]
MFTKYIQQRIITHLLDYGNSLKLKDNAQLLKNDSFRCFENCMCCRYFVCYDSLLEFNSRNLSTEYSLYKYDRISNLYVQDSMFNSEFESNAGLPLYELIGMLSNLQTLTVATDSPILVKELLCRFPTLKIEVAIDQDLSSEIVDYDLSGDERSSNIEFVHLNVHNVEAYDSSTNLNQFAAGYLKEWRANSLQFQYGEFSGEMKHLSFRLLFNLDSLSKIHILNDNVDISDLIEIVKQSHVEWFSSHVSYCFLYKMDRNINGSFAQFGNCGCMSFDDTEEVFKANGIEHWTQFCKSLSSNTTLRELHLSSRQGSHSHELVADSVHFASELLSAALSANKTMHTLAISCQVLSSSFYEALSHNNSSITHLYLSHCDLKHLEYLREMFKHTRSIQKLAIIMPYDKNFDYTEKQMSRDPKLRETIIKHEQSILSFLNTLAINETIRHLEVDSYSRISSEISSKINEQYLNE